MSKLEIENVLSSIRRLVTEDPPVRPRPELLVLTPALRVGADQDAPTEDGGDVLFHEIAEDRGLSGDDDAPAGAEDEPGELTLEDRIADLEARISSSDEEFEPDGSEDIAEHIPQAVLRAAVVSRDRDRDRIRDEADDEAGAATAEETQAPAADAEEPGHGAPGLATGDSAPREPAGPAGGSAPALRRPSAPVAAPERTGTDLVEEAVIDEAALRGMVADLIREELRGELGERITRNVRRLIRREIHRALALKELDDDEDDIED